MDDFSDRLKILISLTDTTNNEFAARINESKSQISRYLSGKGKPGFDTIANIFTIYPDVNPRWMLLGELPIFRDTDLTVSAEDKETILARKFAGIFESIDKVAKESEEKMNLIRKEIEDYKAILSPNIRGVKNEVDKEKKINMNKSVFVP